MKKVTLVAAAFVAALVLVVLVAVRLAQQSGTENWPEAPASSGEEAAHPEFIHGRVTTVDGAIYEGRLRWGGGQEAFWGDFFDGYKEENPWVTHLTSEQLPDERSSTHLLWVKIEGGLDVDRPFMARFGDLARVDVRGNDVHVTLRNGTTFELDRLRANDVDDGVRVWDGPDGVVDLGSRQIRSIEFLAVPGRDGDPGRLYGTVRTPQGRAFTGFVGWDRTDSVGSDILEGRAEDGNQRLLFETIRSIARRTSDGVLVTLDDETEIVLTDHPEVSHRNRGIYVDDERYGRVLVPWNEFGRVDFGPAVPGPVYADFSPGFPLTGRVTTRDGRRFEGKLVYDLDESETTETLDAPFEGVRYTVFFGSIVSIVLPGREDGEAQPARVTLRGGEELQLERSGDLGQGNLGVLIFDDEGGAPEYVPWEEVARIDVGLER